MRHPGRFRIVLLLAISSLLLGCTQEDPIVSYTVKKHDLIQIPVTVGGDEGSEGPALNAPFMRPPSSNGPLTMDDPTDRMLAGLILDGDAAWFIKGMGPIGQFGEDVSTQFDTLLSSISLSGTDKPNWDLGDVWTELPGSGMRAANLQLGEVVFSVIRLGIPAGTKERSYVVDNVNRWRGQLGLGPIDSSQLAGMSHKIKTADGHDATVVDLLGKTNSAAMSAMGTGGDQARPDARSAAGASNADESAAADVPFASAVPTGWKRVAPGMMQLAKFVTGDADDAAQVSVSRAGGSVFANVNRWRGQVGLEPLANDNELDAEAIKVSGIDSMLFRIPGEKDGIVAAMVPHNGAVWFFKLTGPVGVVEEQSAAFDEFLSTVQLK